MSGRSRRTGMPILRSCSNSERLSEDTADDRQQLICLFHSLTWISTRCWLLVCVQNNHARWYQLFLGWQPLVQFKEGIASFCFRSDNLLTC